MSAQRRIAAAIFGTALAAVGLTGCASSGRSATPAVSSSTPTASSTSPTSSTSATASGGASSPLSSSPATSRTCPGGHTSARINGAAKCLAAGQQCSSKAVAQYPQYGFVCSQVGTRLLLRRK